MSHKTFVKVLLRHFRSKLFNLMQRYIIRDKENQDPIHPLDSIDPIVLKGCADLTLYRFFNSRKGIFNLVAYKRPILKCAFAYTCA